MKKITISFLIVAMILLKSLAIAQTTHPFELGFNLGGSWLQSDVKVKKLGGGGGFTFGQMYLQNDKSALDWGWRFRYLNAISYGQDSKKNTGIANNTALNGTADSTLDYFTQPGFVYQNHKTTLNELSLELVIGANRMRSRSKVYPYVFGGVGITKAVAKMNQLNANNVRYDYLSIDSSGNASSSDITTNLNNIYDGSYESDAEGSRSPQWKFMPSLGVGLGYQFTPGFSMGLEHKVTWALSDMLDGQQWANDNTLSASQDKYHYSSIWLKFSFGRATRSHTTTNNVITDQNLYTPAADKPTISIYSPGSSPYTSSSQSYNVKATIKNVSSKSDIGLVHNGVSNSNFTYDATTHVFSFPLMLSSGTNTFMITATNANGSASDNATVLFQSPVINTPPAPAPVVTITSPATNPYTSTMNNATIVATVKNVSSSSQIGVTINGVATSAFIFNASTQTLNVNSNLNPGANTFVISATNASGTDAESITVIFSAAAATPPPFITFVNPAVNPFTSAVNVLPVNAVVQNVTSAGQISVTTNGSPIPTSLLSFNPSTGQLNFTSNLMAGANTVTISATNVAGADSKSITIMYSQPVAAIPPPYITIVNPAVNPFTSTVNVLPINAVVQNVTSVGQISVTTNGAPMPTSLLSFNPSTGQLNFTSNLIAGANTVTVSATNVAGADSKSVTIMYSQPVTSSPAPSVTITSPTVNPFNTSSNTASVNAIVLNVVSSSQIAVTINGSVTSAFSYNMSTKQLTLTANLIAGANIVTVAASNASGSDSKSTTIIYSPPFAVALPVVTITSPSANPFTTATNIVPVNATVLNVTSSAQIAVAVNGSATSSFTYNVATKQLTLSVNLIAGANIVTITGTNSAGTDSKSTTIIYNQPIAVPAPVVTITTPAVSPFNTAIATAAINATVLNVTSSAQISVAVNGATTSAFTYNVATKQLTLSASLVAGANIVTISATNASGNDSKSTTIIYNQPAATPAPVVTITTPAVSPFNTAIATAAVNATVLNVTSSSQISVAINGTTSTFAYNLATKQLTLSASLVAGANIITVSATNPSGSDSKTATIIYTAPSVMAPPIITFTSPAFNPFSTSVNTINITATVLNVTSASQIGMTVNGTATSAFSYNAGTKQLALSTALISGSNTVSITATNSSGSDLRSTVINYNAPVVAAPAPVVTITSPGANPFNTSSSSATVSATVLNVTSSSQISVTINSANVPFTYNAMTNQLTFTSALIAGGNLVTVSATTPSGSDSRSIAIIYTAPVVIPAPVVTITKPSSASSSTNSAVYNVEGTVLNVSSASNITVKVNGVNITAFTYTASTKIIKFNANLVLGNNTVVITATNASGSDSKTVTIKYRQLANPLNPDSLNTPNNPVNPTNPTNPTGTISGTTLGGGSSGGGLLPVITLGVAHPFNTVAAVEVITGSVANISAKTDIVVKVNGVINVFSYNPMKKTFSFAAGLNMGTNIVTITATNGVGSKTETLSVIRN